MSGTQQFIVRVGLSFDRPQAQNTTTRSTTRLSRATTVRYGQLQNLSSTGLTTEAPPALTVWQYDQPLPSSVQWNGGVQVMLPFSAALDVAYTGQHSFNTPTAVNLNSIDFGTSFLPANQNPAAASSPTSTDSTTSYAATNPDLIRFYRGFGTITQQRPYGSDLPLIQLNLTTFRNGLRSGSTGDRAVG
jgi:hypothetical protein